MPAIDPYGQASFSVRNRLMRLAWGIVCALFFQWSPRPFHAWRAFLLTCFGARLGPGCHIYGGARIWAPWNLVCEDVVAIADGAVIYNPALVSLGSHATISQEAYLCGAAHDCESPDFPLIAAQIHIGAYAWICARATVQMGVQVSEGSVLATGGVATKDLEPWTIYGGVPAKKLKDRTNFLIAGQTNDEDNQDGPRKIALGR